MIFRSTLACAYIILLITFLLMVASTADMQNSRGVARNHARAKVEEAAMAILDGCGCKYDRKTINTLFRYLKPHLHLHTNQSGNNSLYAITWVFMILSFGVIVISSYLLSMGFIDLGLSFPFRQWSIAKKADRIAGSMQTAQAS